MYTFLSWILIGAGILGIKPSDSSTHLLKSTEVELTFSHYFGAQPFAFRQKYQTVFGDTIDFERFQYYISNIELVNEDGKTWKEKNSYHLLVLKPNEEHQLSLLLKDVPFKQIKQVRFGIGVDSSRNHGGVQDGDLDPIRGMFWTWSQGYIFLKSEGYHYQNPTQRRGLIYHIGGDECYRELQFELNPTDNRLSSTKVLQILVQVNLEKFFGGFQGAGINLQVPADGTAINVMGGPKSAKIADNYVGMFSLQKTENNSQE